MLGFRSVRTSGTGQPLSRKSRFLSLAASLAILTTIVLSFTVNATPVAAASDGWVQVDRLNLRTGPGTWAEVIDKMWEGDYVAVIDGPTDDGWYQVRYDGSVGWAYGTYLWVNGGLGWSGDSYGGSSSGSDRWIDINRSSQTVTLYEGNTAVGSYWGAMGYDTSSYGFYSTAIGTYYVYAKNANLTWTDWADVYIKYWVAYDSERSNGFHSYSLDANGNVLPNGAGKTGGCVALEPWAASIVYDFATIGTRVEIHW